MDKRMFFPDGNQKSSWDECAWKPRPIVVKLIVDSIRDGVPRKLIMHGLIQAFKNTPRNEWPTNK